MDKKYCIINSILFGILLNLLLPLIFKNFAKPQEIKPRAGASKLSYKGQFMHMMVHHNQVPLMSSLIVAIIVGLSIYLGYLLKPTERLVSMVWSSPTTFQATPPPIPGQI